MTMTLIETKTLGTAAASIEFTSIPQTFTDLVVLISARCATESAQAMRISFNGSTSDFSTRVLIGTGGSVATYSDPRAIGTLVGAGETANTFNSVTVTIPNYASSTNKSYSCDGVSEQNAVSAYQDLNAGLWSNAAAITSLSVGGPNLAVGSTASLYGILKRSDGITTVS